MSTPVEIAQKIERKIEDLEAFRQRLNKFVADKELSKAIIAYEKAKGIETETLKMEGKPVSIIDSIAKGSCAELKGELTDAEIKYKAILVNLTVLQSQLNGFQSVNKHLSVL